MHETEFEADTQFPISVNQMYRSGYICEHNGFKQQVLPGVHSSHGDAQGPRFPRQQWQRF